MATLRINDFIDIGTHGYHNASSWQVALDENFEQIIDESLSDKINIEEWSSMLPEINGKGFYKDLSNLYARCRVHIDHNVSPWYVMKPKNQNDQLYLITEEGKQEFLLDGLETGIN